MDCRHAGINVTTPSWVKRKIAAISFMSVRLACLRLGIKPHTENGAASLPDRRSRAPNENPQNRCPGISEIAVRDLAEMLSGN
jgi:hypothetical protein